MSELSYGSSPGAGTPSPLARDSLSFPSSQVVPDTGHVPSPGASVILGPHCPEGVHPQDGPWNDQALVAGSIFERPFLHPRGIHPQAGLDTLPPSPPSLPSSPPPPSPPPPLRRPHVLSSLNIWSQNVCRNFGLVHTLLETLKESQDIIFLQEPPWRHIRDAPSSTSMDGSPVMGLPLHPDWITVVRDPKSDNQDPLLRPRVAAYVHKRLSRWRPAFRRDLVDHRDILIVSLFPQSGPVHMVNVYSDDKATALSYLEGITGHLPLCRFMGGDFNIRSADWDPGFDSVPRTASRLEDVAFDLGLARSFPAVPGPTHFPRDPTKSRTVIDLVFVPFDLAGALPHSILGDQVRPSDHAPLTLELPLLPEDPGASKRFIERASEEEQAFLEAITKGCSALVPPHPDHEGEVDRVAEAIGAVFAQAWDTHSKSKRISFRSKPWWNEACSQAKALFQQTGSDEDHAAFRRCTRAARREYFDKRIHEIASTTQRPWDLMRWVGPRNLPPCEALRYQGQAVHDIGKLFEALQASYNSAEGRPINLEVLDPLWDRETRSWSQFSALELHDALRGCSSRSAPGPDHITWSHLRHMVSHVQCEQLFLSLANACVSSGHWPEYFKGSRSVIVPKPGKADYSTPKSFRPIALLNTLGKLIEKMIATRMQFDATRNAVLHSNQLGGVMQRSTEDAGLFLTHLVRAGWAKGQVTAVVAFDIAQFFPSISHPVLLAVMRKMGFPPELVTFFESYLQGRRTRFVWGPEESEWFPSSVGVGQGSAASPILSALMVAPVLFLFDEAAVREGIDVTALSYVDDGLLVVQGKDWDYCYDHLRRAYAIIFQVMTDMGLELEHGKTEVFHFTRRHNDIPPPLDLGFAPFTGDTPLCSRLTWRYLGFWFDRRLSFKAHVKFYSTKAFTTVRSMGMLGNSARGLTADQKRLLYRSCVVPIMTYGFRLWFFSRARVKSLLSLLNKAQRKASLWITGAFRTSPTGGTEALAGLTPVHLHLRKLADRAALRLKTLHHTHALHSLLDRASLTTAKHPLALSLLAPGHRHKAGGPLEEMDLATSESSEEFEALCSEARPGDRLLDRFPDRFTFICPPPGRLEEEEEAAYRNKVDTALASAEGDPTSLVVVSDASVPSDHTLAAAASAFIYRSSSLVHSFSCSAGRVLSSCAELLGIRSGLVYSLTQFPDSQHIVVFTDSIHSCRVALDPSLHSGQAHSLAIIRALSPWLTGSPSTRVSFIQVPSRWQWPLHKRAHNEARAQRYPMGPQPYTSSAYLRSRAAQNAKDNWHRSFASTTFRGSRFLNLVDSTGKSLGPSALHHGTWLRLATKDPPTLVARLTRCITAHAPIGEFRLWFFPNEESSCPCGEFLETREHILYECTRFERDTSIMDPELPLSLIDLVDFLRENPLAFAFTTAEPAPSRPPSPASDVMPAPDAASNFAFLLLLIYVYLSASLHIHILQWGLRPHSLVDYLSS